MQFLEGFVWVPAFPNYYMSCGSRFTTLSSVHFHGRSNISNIVYLIHLLPTLATTYCFIYSAVSRWFLGVSAFPNYYMSCGSRLY